MSENLEQQTEELEALVSIYEGDTYFNQLNSTTFQYKYGDNEGENSFNVEIIWHDQYPSELPKISMDTYYNRDISEGFKSKVVEILKAEGETWIGCGMTYTLFECLKEKLTELQAELEEDLKSSKLASVNEYVNKMQIAPVIKTSGDPQSQQPQKKEQLTKSQKRRMWDRTDNKGNQLRGWDWVDIIKHLSQTGGKEEGSQATNPLTNITQQSSVMSHPLN